MTVIETTVYRSPLGLTLNDAVTGLPVADGLNVCTWPKGDPGAARQAWQSPLSPVWGFGPLPGAARYEETVTDDPDAFVWSPPGVTLPFEVGIVDTLRRFLPEVVAIDIPQPLLVALSLYSAPNRPAPPGCATVSGEVAATSGPAAWSVVEVTSGPGTYTTIADQLGRYVVYFPYPEALPPVSASPAGIDPISQITWPVSVSVSYEPSVQELLTDAPSGPPELYSLLGQAPAAVSSGAGTQTSVAATLTFGAPLLVMLDVVPA
jgi:hypothetical protein